MKKSAFIVALLIYASLAHAQPGLDPKPCEEHKTWIFDANIMRLPEMELSAGIWIPKKHFSFGFTLGALYHDAKVQTWWKKNETQEEENFTVEPVAAAFMEMTVFKFTAWWNQLGNEKDKIVAVPVLSGNWHYAELALKMQYVVGDHIALGPFLATNTERPLTWGIGLSYVF
jgi:hypothetical protein